LEGYRRRARFSIRIGQAAESGDDVFLGFLIRTTMKVVAEFLLKHRLAFVLPFRRVPTGLRAVKTPSHFLFLP
jgi:hypothetical protein